MDIFFKKAKAVINSFINEIAKIYEYQDKPYASGGLSFCWKVN